MSKSLVPDWRQKDKIATLIVDLGIGTYRDVKGALGFGRMTPFQRLNYTQVMKIIAYMESLKKERFGQGENGTISRSQRPHPQQPRPIGIPEAAPAGGGDGE